MLTLHDFANATFEPWPASSKVPEGVSWIDAHEPTSEELDFLRHALGIEPPSLARMSEIESTSRFYRQKDAICVTIPLPKRDEKGQTASHPLAMILTPRVLLTVRYEALRACEPQQIASTGERNLTGPSGALVAVVESIVDHLADELEAATARLDQYSRTVFAETSTKLRGQLRGKLLQRTLVAIGRKREMLSLIEETLLTLSRMTPFLEAEAGAQMPPEARKRLDRVALDVASLNSHEIRLSDKVQFLLDASLGFIGIEQNDIFKVLTMVSVVGIPPTLIASMYGMNFKNIPEYDWSWGYQYGLTLIALSAILPLVWFKWRRWW